MNLESFAKLIQRKFDSLQSEPWATSIREFFSTNFFKTAIRKNFDPRNVSAIWYMVYLMLRCCIFCSVIVRPRWEGWAIDWCRLHYDIMNNGKAIHVIHTVFSTWMYYRHYCIALPWRRPTQIGRNVEKGKFVSNWLEKSEPSYFEFRKGTSAEVSLEYGICLIESLYTCTCYSSWVKHDEKEKSKIEIFMFVFPTSFSHVWVSRILGAFLQWHFCLTLLCLSQSYSHTLSTGGPFEPYSSLHRKHRKSWKHCVWQCTSQF